MAILKWLLFFTVGLLLWTALAGWALLEGHTRAPIADDGDVQGFLKAVEAYLDADGHGNIALVLIEGGGSAGEIFRGSAGADTLFPLASLSKWFTAIGVMKLVEDGRVDLDSPVEDYLERWQLPQSTYDHREVTIRRLLSHTAGLTDGLGFGDYTESETVPGVVETLTAPRTSPGESSAIAVGMNPGAEFAYSGGGYLILELVVEEVTGLSFADYMRGALFEPLNMKRTTYQPLFELDNVAPAETDTGSPAEQYQYASAAATGLSSTPAELTTLVLAMIEGELTIAPATVETMRHPEAFVFGAPIWGLGTILYAPDDDDVYVFGHAGQNEPAINTDIRINPSTGDAIIVLSTGNSSIATRVGFLWTFWQTGRPDFFGLPGELERLLPFYLGGVALLLLVCVGGAVRARRKRRRADSGRG